MDLVGDCQERRSDSPHVESVQAARVAYSGITIRQFERAQHAAALLQRGTSILDTVFEAGYFDQPHLTRSLKRWIGHTAAQLSQTNEPG